MALDNKQALASSVGSSGIAVYGGVIDNQDIDRAWRGSNRDKTITAMANDPLIGGILYAIETISRQVDWYVQPADESNAQAVEIADRVQQQLDGMEGLWPGDALSDLLTYLAWGWSLVEIVYELLPDGRIGWKRWALRPQSSRYGWEFGDDGEVIGMNQLVGYSGKVTIPLEKCIHIAYRGGGSPEGQSPLRATYDAWYYKRNIQKIEAIGIERDLAGLPVMRVSAKDIVGNTQTYQAAQEIVTNIRNDAQAGVILASDRDPTSGQYLQELTLLSTGGQRSFDTDTVIKRYANDVASTFLANVMRTGQDSVGSFALAETQSGLFTTAISAHLDIVADAINGQAVKRLVELNGWPDELRPVLTHGRVDATNLEVTGTYLKALTDAGLLVDTPALRKFVCELAGLPVPTDDEIGTTEETA